MKSSFLYVFDTIQQRELQDYSGTDKKVRIWNIKKSIMKKFAQWKLFSYYRLSVYLFLVNDTFQ